MEDSDAAAAASERLVLAAHYLDDAIAGRNIHFIPRAKEAWLYRVFKWRSLCLAQYAAYITYLALGLVEPPGAAPGLRPWPFWALALAEFFCLFILVARLMHELLFTDVKVFWRDAKHVAAVVLLTLIFSDIILNTVLYELGKETASMKLAILINVFRNVRRTLPEIANVILLFLSSQALFALLAFKLLGDESEEFFGTYVDSLWNMYVLATTANHPNVAMPALGASRWYALFFVFYLGVNLYVVMAVFLAVVYNRFRCNLKNEVRESLERVAVLTDKCFEEAASSTDAGLGVTKDTFARLLPMALGRRAASPNYVEAVWLVLDAENCGAVGRQRFAEVPELLKIPCSDETPSPNLFERYFPKLYNSSPSRALVSVVRHRRFRTVFDAAILANAVFIAADLLSGAEHIFLALFTAEILLKLYAFGFDAFFRKLWNVFDAVVVGSALAVATVLAVDTTARDEAASATALDFLMVLRVTRIFKVFHGIPRFRIVLNTLVRILPALTTYGGILFIIFYFFAAVGITIFHGLILPEEELSPEERPFCGNPRLKGTEFASEGYCRNNFNDLASCFIVLYELLVVNQWHVLADGHAKVAGTAWARLFFVAFHLVCVVVVLNIFTAFVLEAFSLEYSVSACKVRSNLAERIFRLGLAHGYEATDILVPAENEQENLDRQLFESVDQTDADHDRLAELGKEFDFNLEGATIPSSLFLRTPMRFHLSYRTKSVQQLLERMFEQDLKTEDIRMTSTTG